MTKEYTPPTVRAAEIFACLMRRGEVEAEDLMEYLGRPIHRFGGNDKARVRAYIDAMRASGVVRVTRWRLRDSDGRYTPIYALQSSVFGEPDAPKPSRQHGGFSNGGAFASQR